MNELLNKIKNKRDISYEKLEEFFIGYLNDKVSDEDMTSVLKAICDYSLTEDNIFNLTDIFIKSGEMLPVSDNFIDKHSTGGVGDKTTLIVLPILASLGVKISKMSGRGLGYTGGTIDKLESIGVKTDFSKDEFFEAIDKHNMVISSQTSNLCPLDKKVYALRDITGTTNSAALIAISVMSKKIASGAKKILIDVKVGKGALVNNIKEAKYLAELMIKIGKKYDRKVVCMLTSMDNPLGTNIGNRIEVLEVLDILNGKNNNLSYLCTKMATEMLIMEKNISFEEASSLVESSITSGKALSKFKEYIESYGGNLDFDLGEYRVIKSLKSGYIKSINSKELGKLSMNLGAGRKEKDDKIDFNAGIILNKTSNDYVKKGEELFKCYGKKIEINLTDVFSISLFKPKKKNIILEIIK